MTSSKYQVVGILYLPLERSCPTLSYCNRCVGWFDSWINELFQKTDFSKIFFNKRIKTYVYKNKKQGLLEKRLIDFFWRRKSPEKRWKSQHSLYLHLNIQHECYKVVITSFLKFKNFNILFFTLLLYISISLDFMLFGPQVFPFPTYCLFKFTAIYNFDYFVYFHVM